MTTTAVAALKSSDGVLKPGGFPAYLKSHRSAALRNVMRATDRRRDAACELGGYSKAEYNRRSEAFVEALLARAPRDVAAHPFARALAFAYASHRALIDARAAVAAEQERAAIVAEAAPEAAPAAPQAPALALDLVPLALGLAPAANDVTRTPPPPAAVPTATALWVRLRAEGLARHREVDGGFRTILVQRVDERYGLSVAVTHPGDFAAVRRVLESFGLPLAERDSHYGSRDFHLFATAPGTPSPHSTPAVRWPGRDDYPAYQTAYQTAQ